MAKQQYPLHVELEGGESFDVIGDQRDVARWEIQPFGGPLSEMSRKLLTFGRFVAWSASVRQGLTDLTWDDFDRTAIEVNEQEKPAPADDAEDPGKRAVSDTT